MNNEIDFTKEELSIIRKMVDVSVTDDEFNLFIETAKRYNLDPIKKQIWCVKYNNAPAKIVVGRDGFLHHAHLSGQFGGMKTFAINSDGSETPIAKSSTELIGAICYVYRKDWNKPLVQAVSLAEYDSNKGIWANMKQVMIMKVAESMALRKAFDVSGVYSTEELTYDDENDAKKPNYVLKNNNKKNSNNKPKNKITNSEYLIIEDKILEYCTLKNFNDSKARDLLFSKFDFDYYDNFTKSTYNKIVEYLTAKINELKESEEVDIDIANAEKLINVS